MRIQRRSSDQELDSHRMKNQSLAKTEGFVVSSLAYKLGFKKPWPFFFLGGGVFDPLKNIKLGAVFLYDKNRVEDSEVGIGWIN